MAPNTELAKSLIEIEPRMTVKLAGVPTPNDKTEWNVNEHVVIGSRRERINHSIVLQRVGPMEEWITVYVEQDGPHARIAELTRFVGPPDSDRHLEHREKLDPSTLSLDAE